MQETWQHLHLPGIHNQVPGLTQNNGHQLCQVAQTISVHMLMRLASTNVPHICARGPMDLVIRLSIVHSCLSMIFDVVAVVARSKPSNSLSSL